MDNISKIKELLRDICGANKRTSGFWMMEIVSVEGDLCTAKINDFEIPNIRLSTIQNGSENGILITPTEGSIVLVADLSGGLLRELAVIGYTEIDSLHIHKEDTTIFADAEKVYVEVGESRLEIVDGQMDMEIGESSVSLTKDLIELNKGSNGGLIQIEELTDKLNDLTKAVNALVDSYNGHTHIGSCSVGPVTTEIPLAQASPAASFKSSDYENPKITH